ncbi:unnamed protein product, partial [Phaeothamnion confervicola]
GGGEAPEFVPTVGCAEHLSHLLSHCFRLAVCGALNRRGRSPLHEACCQNRVASHAECVAVLADWHQVDLYQRDGNNRLVIELLWQAKKRPRSPTGTWERESLLVDRRVELMRCLRADADAAEAADRVALQEKVLDEARLAMSGEDQTMWSIARKFAALRRTLA